MSLLMIITKTPLRISFLGGGTDFPDFFQEHGGAVISSAIDKYVYCIVKERFDKKIYVNYSKKEIVDSVDELEHELVREALKITGIRYGIEISFLSDIPAAGSGLGSSSSSTVGVLNALYNFLGEAVPAEKLAREACQIEIERCDKPIGAQDQYIAAYGGLKYFEFKKNGGVEVQGLTIDQSIREDFDNYLMLFFTGITRRSETVLMEQKRKIGDTAQILVKMAEQAREAKRFLEAGMVTRIGDLLDQGWEYKKQLASRISNPEIDDLHNLAKEAGALGGKISGAGAGGFMLLFVPSENRESVRRALANLREMPFRLERDGSKVIFNSR